jgi:hypothetical protein
MTASASRRRSARVAVVRVAVVSGGERRWWFVEWLGARGEIEAEQGVAAAQRGREVGAGGLRRAGEEPQGASRELDGERVEVDAVEAARGDQAAGVLREVGEVGGVAVAGPGGLKLLAELAAGLEQEGAAAERGVADLEAEELRGFGALAEGGEHGLEGGADDRAGQRARRVVGAAASPRGVGREPERAARAGDHAQAEHRLVGAADLLELEIAGTDRRAVDEQQGVEGPPQRVVGEAGRLAARVEGEEAVLRAVEEVAAVALTQLREAGEQRRPAAASRCARLRAEPSVQRSEPRLAREQTSVLGVQHEQQAQHGRDEAALDLAGVDPAEQRAVDGDVGGDEALQQRGEGDGGLFGEAQLAGSRGGARAGSRGGARAGSRGGARVGSRGGARVGSRGEARVGSRGEAQLAGSRGEARLGGSRGGARAGSRGPGHGGCRWA